MNLQDLVRERIIGNIKTGKKNEKGIPEKLPYFHVEEDKGTSYEMVNIFKQLYPNKPTKLKIRFTSENPFNFKFKRYVKGKAVCIGNGTKAITVGKDDKGNNIQIEVECSEECQQLKEGKCKLKGSLKFELEGINAGGLWNLSTCGGISLSNIASEIYKYKKAGISIVGVPFELTLTEQQSLVYGTYYSIDLHRTDIKPQLVESETENLIKTNSKETKQLTEGTGKEKKENTKKDDKKEKNKKENNVVEKKEEQNNKVAENNQKDISNYMTIKEILSTVVNGKNFNKIILNDVNKQDVEYILHPKADNKILEYSVGTIIEIESAKVEANMNILCKYSVKERISADDTINEDEELEKAV